MTWKNMILNDIDPKAYFDQVWRSGPRQNFVIIRHRSNKKFYISPNNSGLNSGHDQGPYDTLEVAKVIYRILYGAS